MQLRKMQNVGICVLMLAVVMALYSPVIGHPFVNYDDDDYVTENAHIRGGVAWSTVAWAFVSAPLAFHQTRAQMRHKARIN